jgi:RHS repeat-associated protein
LTVTIRGLGSKVLREYELPFGGAWNWSRDYVYRDGLLLASVEPKAGPGEKVSHFHLDHLGSLRQVTDGNGSEVAFHTYYPFGGEATDPEQDQGRLKFTGHERDENGSSGPGMLDYMHARYCSPGLGRFLSRDPVMRSREATKRPQLWNRYAYSAGNPLIFVDPDGRDIFYAHDKDRKFYEKAAARNVKVRQVLGAFAPGTGRDLFVKRGDAGSLSSGVPLNAKVDINTGREPSQSAMIDAYNEAGGGVAGTKAAEKIYEAARNDVTKATITLGPAASAKNKLHELGHIDQALRAPVDFREQGEEARKAANAVEYGESASETYAVYFALEAGKKDRD